MENTGNLKETVTDNVPEIDVIPGYIVKRSYMFRLNSDEMSWWRVINYGNYLLFVYGDLATVSCLVSKKDDKWVVSSFEYTVGDNHERSVNFMDLCCESWKEFPPALDEKIKQALIARLNKFGNPFDTQRA